MSEVTQPKHPVFELLARYKAIFKVAWAHRAELAGPRRFAWGLTLLFVLALLWSFFGQVDIVAVAPGRIMVSERTKVIQPLEASVVRKVLVKDGDRVKAGQVLVELDPTMASADMASVQEQLRTQASEVMRTDRKSVV